MRSNQRVLKRSTPKPTFLTGPDKLANFITTLPLPIAYSAAAFNAKTLAKMLAEKTVIAEATGEFFIPIAGIILPLLILEGTQLTERLQRLLGSHNKEIAGWGSQVIKVGTELVLPAAVLISIFSICHFNSEAIVELLHKIPRFASLTQEGFEGVLLPLVLNNIFIFGESLFQPFARLNRRFQSSSESVVVTEGNALEISKTLEKVTSQQGEDTAASMITKDSAGKQIYTPEVQLPTTSQRFAGFTELEFLTLAFILSYFVVPISAFFEVTPEATMAFLVPIIGLYLGVHVPYKMANGEAIFSGIFSKVPAPELPDCPSCEKGPEGPHWNSDIENPNPWANLTS